MKEPGEPCFLENSPKSIEDIACVMIVRNERERERSQRPVEFGSKVRWTSRIREADYICRGIVEGPDNDAVGCSRQYTPITRSPQYTRKQHNEHHSSTAPPHVSLGRNE